MSLYQCFLTLPSVLVGKVYGIGLVWVLPKVVCYHCVMCRTLAISAQLCPASRICLRRSSSAGVHGVFVRLFLAGGGWAAAWLLSAVGGAGWVGVAIAAGGVGTGIGVGPEAACWTGVGTDWGGSVTGAVGVAAPAAAAAAAAPPRLRPLGCGAGAGAG